MKLHTVCAFFVLLLVQTYSQTTDPCAQYPTCKECIEHNPCGWCAEPIVYQDGSRGPYCAGKPENPDKPPPGYKPWTCPKDFQNTACYGYICEKDHFSCISSGTPNGGVPLAECQATCFPPTYDCNATTHKCYQVTPGHGTDLPSCEAKCSQTTTGQSTGHTTGQTTGETTGSTGGNKGYTCDPVSLKCKEPGSAPQADCEATCGKPQNVTPIFALGDYRGLQVSHGFLKGEWQARITEESIVIVDPTGKKWAQGVVRLYQNELWLVTGQGTRRGLFALQNLPEVTVLTWGMGEISGSVPTSFDAAMGKGTTFVFAKCINPNNCKWHIFAALNRLKLLQDTHWKRNILADPLNDPCSVYPDCHSCIAAPEFCGWCSVNVIYNNSIIGKNCAGINKTISPRINCTGTFSTQDCSHATTGATTTATTATTGGPPADDKYECDPITNTCKKSDNGTLPKDVCAAQCVLTPIVPPELQDRYFRGLQVDIMYVQGEWRLHFGKTDATLVNPSGVVITATVTTTAQYLTLTLKDGTKIQTIWQLQNGPSTGLLSWALGKANGPAPKNFDEAMTTSGQKEFFFVSCLPGASADVCDFSK